LLTAVRETAASRLSEGYIKGVHDADAAKLLGVLVQMQQRLGLLRFPSVARTCAAMFWMEFPEGDRRDLLAAKLRGFGAMKRAFPTAGHRREYIRELHGLLHEFAQRTGLFPEDCLNDATEFLYFTLKHDQGFVVSAEAARLADEFEAHLRDHHLRDAFTAARSSVEAHIAIAFELTREWVQGFASARFDLQAAEFVDEAAWLILRGSRTGVLAATMCREVEDLAGSHSRIADGKLSLHFADYMRRVRAHEHTVVPLYERFTALKRTCMDDARRPAPSR
jgi:hypothetical protein